MPLYSFKCLQCNVIESRMVAIKDRDSCTNRCNKCANMLRRLIVAPPPPTIMELGSKYHGKQVRKDIQKVLKKRSRDDMLQNVGEYIEKHGIDNVQHTTLLNGDKKRTSWDDK